MDPLTAMAMGKARQLANQNSGLASNLDYAVSELEAANADIRRANKIIADQAKEIERLKWELLVERAHSEGMKAYRDELLRGAPNNPAMGPSGQFYKNGDAKPWAAIMYERTFDRILRDARVFDPEKHRYQ